MSITKTHKSLLCRVGLHHYHDELTADGQTYRRCTRCGKDKSDYDHNDRQGPNVAGNMAANFIGRPM